MRRFWALFLGVVIALLMCTGVCAEEDSALSVPSSVSLKVGQSKTLNIGTNYESIEFSVGDKSIISFDASSRTIKGLKAGRTTISIFAVLGVDDIAEASVTVTVKAAAAARIELKRDFVVNDAIRNSMIPAVEGAENFGIMTEAAKLRNGDGEKIAVLPEGMLVRVTGPASDKRVPVRADGLEGTVASSCVTAFGGFTGAANIGAGSANLRYGPGMDYAALDIVNVGDSALTIGSAGGWSLVYTDGGTGYVANKLLAQAEAANDAVLAPLSMPEGGSIRLQVGETKSLGVSYAIGGAAPAWSIVNRRVATIDGSGQNVNGVGAGRTYAYLSDSSDKVWIIQICVGQDLEPQLSATEVTGISARYTVVCRELNVRSGPGTSYKKLGTLKRGDTIEGTAGLGGWIGFAWADGTTGYCNGKYLSK